MNEKNLLKTVLWSVVLVVLLGGAYLVYSKNEPNNNPGSNVSDGGQNKANNSSLKPAYDFELTDLAGNNVKLSDYKGKIVFLNFWATWCPPCRSELPEFNEANKIFEKNADAVLLAVNLTTGGARGETEDVVRQFISEKGYTMKVLLDKTGSVADKYSIYSIPTTYVINKDGNIYTYYEGAIDENTLMDAYNKLKE
ncbi:TlpA family protein disulfide reductase [Acetivibrio cellulolyticus]|uniref:TlpA family protein disulfide reductase n=1 Tax=Acetivibrio cellulolyticus TaxID=35830 RepID=UPI0001E2E271|nr:TlpA disulfide reductase family protein [Acetivibrio cellulolyticus]